MSQYPEKTCHVDRLVRQPKLVAAALEGRKTQQRRDGIYGYPGENFILDGVAFEITGLVQQRLGDMTDADVQAEGYASLDMYKNLIVRMHPGMIWDDEHPVWVHQFEKVLQQAG